MRFKITLVLIMFFGLTLSGLFAVETMGLYEGKRLSAPADEPKAFLDVAVWSYTRPGYLNIQVAFGKDDPKELKKGGPDVYQFYFELTREDYEKVFEGETSISVLHSNDIVWSRKISTAIYPEYRVIKIEFENGTDGEVSEVFKRGSLEIIMTKGQLTSLKLVKERKKLFGGFSTVFLGEVKTMRKVKNGIALMDDNEIGRLTKKENIDFALKHKTSSSFSEALENEEKKK